MTILPAGQEDVCSPHDVVIYHFVCKGSFTWTLKKLTLINSLHTEVGQDRLKLIRLYPCGSLRQGIHFIFGAQVGYFAATPQSDVEGIWSHDLSVIATLLVQQKMPYFRAFITLRSQFHLHHRSQRALTEIV